MELQFSNSSISCLKQVLSEVRNQEQAQEIRLTDGMPDIGRVLCGWGQVLQRSKEWSGDAVSLSAGMMVFVLYAPEDGSECRWVEGWIPFSFTWDLPETISEGSFRVKTLVRFVDARSVSARKIMVRAGIGAMAQVFCPEEARMYAPQQVPPDVELQKVSYPMEVPMEAGEKTFSMEEELNLPGTVPPMEKLVYYTLTPEIQEQRVMTDKVVFKGNAGIHILYLGKEGDLHSWDFHLPFSQFADLSQEKSPEADCSVCPEVTALEAEQDGEGILRLKCSMTAQYVVYDRILAELTEDAYSPGRELTTETEDLCLYRMLDKRRETVPAEIAIPEAGNLAADVTFLPDFPRGRMLEGKSCQELSGSFQILYYGSAGELQATVSRWEGQQVLPCDAGVQVTAVPLSPSEPQILMGGGDMKVRTEFPLQMTVETAAGIPMVTGLALGEEKLLDENRPSLILRRAGTQDLWDIAKNSGSTVAAIQAANHLTDAPVPGQMLLIPIL